MGTSQRNSDIGSLRILVSNVEDFIIGFGLWGNVPQAAGLGSTGLSRPPVNTAGHQAESNINSETNRCQFDLQR